MKGQIPNEDVYRQGGNTLKIITLVVCCGVLFPAGVRAEKPAKVMGAVKTTPVSNVVVPVQVAVPNDMKKETSAVAGAVKTGGVVAATPISIPRPIQLEKITKSQLPASVTQSLPPAGVGSAQSQNDVVQSAEIISVKGNEATLRVGYMYDRARPAPVYAGAFIYDAQGNTVNAGYKPAIAGRPQGFIDINLVLPETPFYSNHIVVFFMESGQPVFMNGRFSFAYNWENGALTQRKHQLAEFQEAKPAMPILSNEEFCAGYANTAVAQYDYAITNGLPGIVPPVWSNDRDHHYQWCLTVSRDEVMQGQKLRQSYIDERAPAGVKKFGQLADAIKQIDAGKFTPGGEAAVIKPQPNKQLDPGLGP